MCFVWISEQTAIISLYSINWLVFITETEHVYCAVRTGSLNLIKVNLSYKLFSHRPFQWPLSPLATRTPAASFPSSIRSVFPSNPTHLPSCPYITLHTVSTAQTACRSQYASMCSSFRCPTFWYSTKLINSVRVLLCLFIGNGEERQDGYWLLQQRTWAQFNSSTFYIFWYREQTDRQVLTAQLHNKN
jgi:hypothetical protein